MFERRSIVAVKFSELNAPPSQFLPSVDVGLPKARIGEQIAPPFLSCVSKIINAQISACRPPLERIVVAVVVGFEASDRDRTTGQVQVLLSRSFTKNVFRRSASTFISMTPEQMVIDPRFNVDEI